MAQISFPANEQNFSVQQWRYAIGNEPGIKEDINGTAYGLTFATSSDEAMVGSTSIDSISNVGGAGHVIPAGQLEPITIPPLVSTTPGVARTDLIGVRFDETFDGPDEAIPSTANRSTPCRLYRIPGVEGGGVPVYDSTPPGVEDFILWEVTRKANESLAQATRKDRRIRTGPNLLIDKITDLPTGVPLGSVAYTKVAPYAQAHRTLDPQGNPVWATHWLVAPTYTRVPGGADTNIESKTIIGYTVPSPGYPFRAVVDGTLRINLNGPANYVVTLRTAAGGQLGNGGTDIDQDELRDNGGTASVWGYAESPSGAPLDFGLILDRQSGAAPGVGTASVAAGPLGNNLTIRVEPLT